MNLVNELSYAAKAFICLKLKYSRISLKTELYSFRVFLSESYKNQLDELCD